MRRKIREAFSPQPFHSIAQTAVLTYPSCEKSPEDVFNIDSKLVEKIPLKDKSISLSIIDSTSPTNILRQINMHNIISNRLYDEHALDEQTCEKQHSCNISYENEIETKTETDVAIKFNSCNCVYLNKFDNCLNELNNRMYMGQQPQCFGKQSTSIKIDQNRLDEGERRPHVTGRDLLIFAKQIATGMVFEISIHLYL